MKASVEAFTASISMDDMEAMEDSVEDSTEVMKAFADIMKVFTEVTSTGAFVEASVEDMEYMTASTELTSGGASTKASTINSMEVTSRKASVEAFMDVKWKLSRKLWQLSRK